MAIQNEGWWWRVNPFQPSQTDSYFRDKYWTWEVWNGPELVEWGYTTDKEDSIELARRYYKGLSIVSCQ